ncbi:MAG: TIGR02281 family clan AA aspartic protease [Pseudomonadota bacterium]
MRARNFFWPVVLIALWLLAWFLVGAPDGEQLWDDHGQDRLVYMMVFAAGITIASAGRLLFEGGPQTSRHAVVWTAVLICVALAYSSKAELGELYDRFRGNIHPSVAVTTARGEAELQRAWDGHYRAESEINGVRVMMLVDTGASMVLLPHEEIGRLGIDPATLDYTLPVTTANGKSSVAPIRLSSIKIGPIAVFDVEAAVAQPGRLKMGLLGMSFLERLDETSFRKDRLILRN